ncbi:hypothetical protein TWF281_009525 [Arthrobotrys megalospora]
MDKQISDLASYFNGPGTTLTKISQKEAEELGRLYINLTGSQCLFFNKVASLPAALRWTTHSELEKYRPIVTEFQKVANTQSRLYATLVDTLYFSDLEDQEGPELNLNGGQTTFNACSSNAIRQWQGT